MRTQSAMTNMSDHYSQIPAYGNSLSDWDGYFCAFCLKTIGRREKITNFNFPLNLCQHLENHHVFPKAAIEKLVNPQFPGGWIVPTHRDCHREIFQPISNIIPGMHLLRILDEDSSLENFGQMQHNRGDYWGSVIAKLIDLRRTPVSDRNKRLRLTRHSLASASGIRTRAVPILLKQFADMFRDDPGILFHTANFHANRGHMKNGRKFYELGMENFEKSSRKKREEEISNFANRRLQFEPSMNNAKEARIITESNAYTKSTSLVLTSSLLFNTAPYMSDASLEELSDDNASQSWLYTAERQFIQACRELANQKRNNPQVTASVYGKLIRAQYILCMMGHQCVPHPSLPFLNYKNHSTIMPGQVLLSLIRPESLTAQKCSELREQYIKGSNLFVKIMDTLCGR